MPSKRERGKIPHENWEAIATRYRGGETFASIARSFGCTPPAIRYIVTRTSHDAAQGDPGGAPGRPVPAAPERVIPEAARRNAAGAGQGGQAGGVDAALRQRVNSDIAAFLVAFDSMFETNTPEARGVLLEATDRLLRAGARTRLAIEEAEEGLISGEAAITGRRAVASSGRRG